MSPGAGGQLAELFIQFTTKGVEEIKAAIKNISEAIKVAVDQSGKLAEAFKHVGDVIAVSLGGGLAIIANFVRQGVAAGAMGQLLSFQMEQTARVMAGLFRPEIMKAIEALRQITNWIRSLTDAQKQSIAYWIEGAAAAAAVAVILPRIIIGIRGISLAVVALGEAIAAGELATGVGAILPILGLIAQVVTFIAVGTETGRSALSKLWEIVKEVGKAFAKVWDKIGMNAFLNVLDDAVKKFTDFVSAAWEGLKVNELFEDIVGLIGDVVKLFGQLVPAVVDFVTEFFKMTGLDGVLKGIVNTLIEIAKWVVKTLRDMVREATFTLQVLRNLFSNDVRLPGEFRPSTAKPNRGEEGKAAGGFESLQASYQRIAVAALRASAGFKSPEERTAAAVEEANRHLARIDEHTGNPRPILTA